ncbi:MAG: LytR C-terminal domain-containing protein, partial [Eubacterium sp.]|nr:LytR C-terminal domain-containing protein [Eubacterium sp.]
TYTHVITVNTGNESSNLIYSYDEKTKKIKAMVLELFDQNTKNLTYVTIPVNSQIAISQATYAEFLEASKKAPQLATLADINDYFSGDVAYEYGIRVLQEAMDVDIGYFTALPSDKFDTYFQKKSEKEPLYMPSQALLDQAGKCTSEGDMEDFIEEKWDELISDATLSQKQKYAESLLGVNKEFIHVHGVYGESNGQSFTIDGKKSAKLVNNIWELDAYTSPQTIIKGSLCSSSGSASSASCKIQVTNGTGINGLASSYMQKLQGAGYNVIGVGNYVGTKQTTTTIYVKKKKWGKDLLQYFKNATIKVSSDLTNNADIEIILGTEDAL